MPELPFLATPPTLAGGRLLPTPASFYLTGEDRIRITSWVSINGYVFGLFWRMADSSGRIIANRNTHTPTANRQFRYDDFEIGTGSLLNLTVGMVNGSPAMNTAYVVVQLVRGFDPAALVIGTLLAGHVTGQQPLGWPGSPIVNSLEGPGYLKAVVGTQPAVGVEINESVPDNALWEFLSVDCSLTTSAAAGNRVPFLVPQSGGVFLGRSYVSANVAPSASVAVSWQRDAAWGVDPGGANYIVPLPARGALFANANIKTVTLGLAAGDQWSAPRMLVREWISALH